MDVAASTDRGGVAEHAGYRFDGAQEVAFGFLLRTEFFEFL